MKDMNAVLKPSEQNYKLLVQKILESISEPTSWKNTVSPLINLLLFGFQHMDLMMAIIMLRQIPIRNMTCINIPLKGQLNGFSHYLDLNQIAPTQDQEAIYRKLFKVQKDGSSS
mgnify:CR=1 FL=1